MASVKNRTFRFEVQIAHEGQWIIRNVYNDEREAMNRARSMVHTERMAEAIKVMQFRTAPNGFTTEKELLVIDRLEAYRKQEFQVAKVEHVDVCAQASDFMKLDARRVIEKLLRPYLGVQSLTPTEFLHLVGYQREIDRKGRLVESALHTAARLQADAVGKKTPDRYEELTQMAREIQVLAQDFAYESRDLPAIDGTNFKAVAVAIEKQVPADRVVFFLTASVCQYLMQHRAMMDKLERLVTLLGSSDKRGIAILDGLFADAITAPGLMRDLLGPQISLADHISQCLKVLRGEYGVEEVGGQRFLTVISHMISAGLCPQSADSIRQHLVRAFVSEAPLDRRELDPVTQRRQLEALVRELVDEPCVADSRDALDAAINRRRRRLRSELLRREGLEELADQAL